MKPGMIELEPPKKDSGWRDPKHAEFAVRFALPFWASEGAYTHRIRSGRSHVHDGKNAHVTLHMWCGQMRFISPKRKRGGMVAEIPDGAILCATCEGRAIGAGLVDHGQINGREVAFSPRRMNA